LASCVRCTHTYAAGVSRNSIDFGEIEVRVIERNPIVMGVKISHAIARKICERAAQYIGTITERDPSGPPFGETMSLPPLASITSA